MKGSPASAYLSDCFISINCHTREGRLHSRANARWTSGRKGREALIGLVTTRCPRDVTRYFCHMGTRRSRAISLGPGAGGVSRAAAKAS